MEECRPRSSEENVCSVCNCRDIFGRLLSWTCPCYMWHDLQRWIVSSFFWHIHFSNPYVSEWSIHWWLSIDYFRILDLTYVLVTTLCVLSAQPLNKAPLAFRLGGVVPAFHGHAHNHGCQVEWHSLDVEGIGLEDFEECECTFCRSNELASVTHLASPFHCQQHINEHFHFHDLDKHIASGKLFPFCSFTRN